LESGHVFVILCRDQEQAESALEKVKRWVEKAGSTLHPEKTHIVNSREKSFAFLKRHWTNPKRIYRKQRWPNAYFSERGYKSLRVAHSAYVESLEGTH